MLAFTLKVLPSLGLATATPQDRKPDAVIETRARGSFRLENRVISAKWSVTGGRVNRLVITDRMHETELPVTVPFAILLTSGTIYDVGTLRLAGQPVKHELTPRPDASRLADRLHGEQFDVPLESGDHSLHVTWSLLLLDDSSYVRQLLAITAAGQDVPISRVELIDLPLRGAHVSGSVEGSPIIAGNLFLGFEHPLSKSKVTGDRARSESVV